MEGGAQLRKVSRVRSFSESFIDASNSRRPLLKPLADEYSADVAAQIAKSQELATRADSKTFEDFKRVFHVRKPNFPNARSAFRATLLSSGCVVKECGGRVTTGLMTKRNKNSQLGNISGLWR